MDIAKTESEISDLNQEKIALIKDMEEIKQRFFEALTKFLSDWSRTKVESEVRENPDTTTEAANDGSLSMLKEELSKLLEDMDSTVQSTLNKPIYWSHDADIDEFEKRWQKKHGGIEYIYGYNRIPPIFDEQVRLILGKTGELLRKYKYGYGKYNVTEWEKHYFGGGDQYRYSLGFNPSSETLETLELYAKSHKKLITLHKAIKKLEKSIAEHKAQNLWNDA